MQLKKFAKCSAKACDFSTLLLAQVPCDVLSGGEGLLTCLGRLPQGIVSGFCWCKTLQECLDAIIFVVIEELFEILCCCYVIFCSLVFVIGANLYGVFFLRFFV
jgi:hypothetical protein